MLLGIACGLLAAVMRQTANPVLQIIAGAYVWIFRSIPILVQILIWFNLALIVPEIGIPGVFALDTNDVMSPFVASLIALGIGEGAYVAEIIRSGISSVPLAQTAAGSALGLSRSQVYARIILPQAVRVMVPPLGSEFINMLKLTSLAYTIGFTELMSAASQIYHKNYFVVELLFTASIWYIIVVSVFSWGQGRLEKRLNRPHGAALEQVPFWARLVRDLSPVRSKA
jgi:polar amino acid transport system permease protein